MRYAVCLLLVAALSPTLWAQEGLTVEVEPVVEGKALPGKEYTLKLRFTVPDGYHAYHKDNPGYSQAVNVTWNELSGLELVKAEWPEPHKHVDEYSEEWELSGVFDIVYTFKVPADATGTLSIRGHHETQFCDADRCMQSEDDFSTSIEVASADEATAEPEQKGPRATATATFGSTAQAGGKATLEWKLETTEGYHAYHKDNPGYSQAVKFTWTELSGLKLLEEIWPEPKKHIDEFSEEWELPDGEPILFVFEVPADAKGELTLKGKWTAQVCDADACFVREGATETVLVVDGRVEGSVYPATEKKDDTRPSDAPAPEFSPYVTSTVPSSVEPGKEFDLKLSFTLPKGFHAFHKDSPHYKGMNISLDHLSGVERKGEEIWPKYEVYTDPDTDREDWRYSGTFTVTYPMRALDSVGPGIIEGAFQVEFYDDMGCMHHTGTFSVTTSIGESAADPVAAVDEHGFYLDFDYALAKARAEGKELLVDFNGKFCKPCRIMEKTVFTLPEVHELMQQYVVVSIKNDVGNERYNELWDQYRPPEVTGVPYYLVLDHEAKALRGITSTLPAEDHAHEFVAFLKGEKAAEPPAGTTIPDPMEASKAPEGWPEGLLPGIYKRIEPGFEFEARFSTAKIKPGTEVTLELHFKTRKNAEGHSYHLHHPTTPSEFAIPLEIIDVGQYGLVGEGDWQFPGYEEHDEDMGDGTTDRNHYMIGDVVIVRKFKVPADLKPGNYMVWGHAKGQYCDDKGCVEFIGTTADAPNRMFGWLASIEVSPEGSDSQVLAVDQTNKTVEEQNSPRNTGFFWFLFFAFLAGIVTLLTPCVLPVLPLTIGFFVSQSSKGKSPLLTAFIYCSCIVASFTLFGLIASVALKSSTGAQDIATNGYVNLALALMFIVFALSFLGLFELRVPNFITQWFTKKQMGAQKEGHGYAKAFFSGSAFSLISFSCTGPIAGTFLAQAATGSFWLPTAAMLAFSSGMALPIFIMGQFPSLLKKMPKSGGWMNAMKVVFGFVEVGLAILYIAKAEQAFGSIEAAEWVSRYIVISVWGASSLAIAIYLFGFFRMPHDHEETKQIGVVRSVLALGFLAFAIYMLPGMFGAKYGNVLEGILPPPPQNGGIQLAMGGSGKKLNDHHDLPWHKDFEEGMAEAKSLNKPVFLDFTGYN